MREEQEPKGSVGAPGDVVKGSQTPPRPIKFLVPLEIPKEVGKYGRE